MKKRPIDPVYHGHYVIINLKNLLISAILIPLQQKSNAVIRAKKGNRHERKDLYP